MWGGAGRGGLRDERSLGCVHDIGPHGTRFPAAAQTSTLTSHNCTLLTRVSPPGSSRILAPDKQPLRHSRPPAFPSPPCSPPSTPLLLRPPPPCPHLPPRMGSILWAWAYKPPPPSQAPPAPSQAPPPCSSLPGTPPPCSSLPGNPLLPPRHPPSQAPPCSSLPGTPPCSSLPGPHVHGVQALLQLPQLQLQVAVGGQRGSVLRVLWGERVCASGWVGWGGEGVLGGKGSEDVCVRKCG